jgi:endonuclease/exonuclease/phosphatase family metal-dependent hydrolase
MKKTITRSLRLLIGSLLVVSLPWNIHAQENLPELLQPEFHPAKESQPAIVLVEKENPVPEVVRVGFWNIQWFPTLHPSDPITPEKIAENIKRVASVIEKEDPTIMLACEIRDVESLTQLGLNFSHIACTTIPRTEDEGADLPNQGLGLLSKIPWEEIWVVDFSELPQTQDRPSRGLIGAKFKLAGDRNLIVYGVHMKSNRGGVEGAAVRRERAVEYWLADMKKRNLDPEKDLILFVGDFNSSPRDPRFVPDKSIRRILDAGFVLASDGMTAEQAVTIPGDSRYPPNDFDHMFLSKALAGQMAGAPPWLKIVEVPKELSDHYPIFLPLNFKE